MPFIPSKNETSINFVDCYWITETARGSLRIQEKKFDPIFNDKKLLIRKTFNNKVYEKLNCAPNSKNLVLHFC
jgi:hypothetical protein